MTRVAVDANFNEVEVGSDASVQEFESDDPGYVSRRAAVDGASKPANEAEPEEPAPEAAPAKRAQRTGLKAK